MYIVDLAVAMENQLYYDKLGGLWGQVNHAMVICFVSLRVVAGLIIYGCGIDGGAKLGRIEWLIFAMRM